MIRIDINGQFKAARMTEWYERQTQKLNQLPLL